MNSSVFYTQTNETSTGQLRVDVTSMLGNRPISGATVRIYSTGEPETLLEEVTTNVVGQTEFVSLPAPDESLSMEPSAIQPYSEYNIEVTAPGFETITISGIDILPNTRSIQNLQLIPMNDALGNTAESFTIPENTLFGDFPPKIAESETKTVAETGEIVLSRVVIPEYIVVHDGPPTDSSAKDYYVKYKDYIKNVASSEIYATWPEATIMANILAIQSFTLNRIYTEWYRNKGYNFNITTSTAYDQKWVYNRNIFEEISVIVDSIFDQYLARPNITQPILTQYCDGKRVTCPNWLSQWGSKALGDQGYSAGEIIDRKSVV